MYGVRSMRVTGFSARPVSAGELARDAVVAPQVGAVRQGLVVHLKDDVADRVRLGDRRAQRQVVGDLPQAAVVGADAELLFGAAHAV